MRLPRALVLSAFLTIAKYAYDADSKSSGLRGPTCFVCLGCVSSFLTSLKRKNKIIKGEKANFSGQWRFSFRGGQWETAA